MRMIIAIIILLFSNESNNNENNYSNYKACGLIGAPSRARETRRSKGHACNYTIIIIIVIYNSYYYNL